MNLRRFIGLALWSMGPGAAGAASGAPLSAPPPAPAPAGIVLATAPISMDEAVKIAEQRFHARVVKAEAQHDNGHTVYVLRLLNESGQVWTVRVDAASGAVL